jgi:hypothetical protein
MADLVLDNDDLNGDCFIAGAEGEPEISTATNIVQIPPGFNGPNDADAGAVMEVNGAMANSIIKLNYVYLRNAGRAPDVAARSAYIRFLALKNGLVSQNFTVAAHNVRYNHTAQLTQADYDTMIALYTNEWRDNLVAVLPAEVRKNLRLNFADYTCCVAYIFRVRGHHYKDEFEDRYKTLWARCLKTEAELPIAWQYIATDALHAIMPDILDSFWANCVATSRCAGTLIKRFDSAPAGCAGVSALKRGLDDVLMLFPGVVRRVPGAHAAFNRVVTSLANSRWGGSINCRFYGVQRIRVDESQIGALASVVMGIYEQLAHDSKLRESPALRRLAEIAPATGGAMGLAALRATKDESLSLIGSTDSVADAPAPAR